MGRDVGFGFSRLSEGSGQYPSGARPDGPGGSFRKSGCWEWIEFYASGVLTPALILLDPESTMILAPELQERPERSYSIFT